METEHKVAVLFDAENIASKYTPVILNEANALGSVIIRRIYGDWTAREMSSWKQMILDHSIQPIQQYRNVSGKNSSDSALIIDAMDLLYEAAQPEKTEKREKSRNKGKKKTGSQPAAKELPSESRAGSDLAVVRETLVKLAEENSSDDGWILSSKLAELLTRKLPDFDVRNFRYKKFVQFVESLQLFETKRQAAEGELVHTIYFRVKA